MTNLAAANSRFVGVVCDICSLSARGALGQYHSFIHHHHHLAAELLSIDRHSSQRQSESPALSRGFDCPTDQARRIGT